MLIMLTRGRAQRLVLKAAEQDELEAYRLLFRRYEPISTVTTLSKLVEFLATTFSGDLMDSSTNFERRVTSWEHDAEETLSDLINIGVVTKVLDKGGFRDHPLINAAGTKEWTKFVKEIEGGFVGDWQPGSKVPRKLFIVWNLRSYGERPSKENRILATQPNKWMVWHRRQRQRQARHGQGQRQARQRQGPRQEQEQRKG